MIRKNLINKVFGKITVIGTAPNRKSKSFWKCKCDCGTIKEISAASLINGHTKSCGCIRKEIQTTHNLSKTRSYKTWQHMKQRCFNEKEDVYKNYGGRGIKINNDWLSFENFL